METVLLGNEHGLFAEPEAAWRREVMHHGLHVPARLSFMTADHHRVRDYVVIELPRRAKAIGAEQIAADLDLPLAQVGAILDDLEAHLTFLFRDAAGHVAWAYPVTADRTPHKIQFSSGEQIYGA